MAFEIGPPKSLGVGCHPHDKNKQLYTLNASYIHYIYIPYIPSYNIYIYISLNNHRGPGFSLLIWFTFHVSLGFAVMFVVVDLSAKLLLNTC